MSLYDENVAKGLKAGGSFPHKDMVSGLMLIPMAGIRSEKHNSKLHTFFKTPCRNMGCFVVL